MRVTHRLDNHQYVQRSMIKSERFLINLNFRTMNSPIKWLWHLFTTSREYGQHRESGEDVKLVRGKVYSSPRLP